MTTHNRSQSCVLRLHCSVRVQSEFIAVEESGVAESWQHVMAGTPAPSNPSLSPLPLHLSKEPGALLLYSRPPINHSMVGIVECLMAMI